MSTVELSTAPDLGRLYRQAALGLRPGRRRPAALPETELVLRGVAVDRGRLAAYDRVCGFGLADRLPVTYPQVLAFPVVMRLMVGDDFPFPVVGMVHVANRIHQRRPVDADEPLDVAVRATDLRPHPRGHQLDVVTVATVAGTEVWRAVATYLRRDRPSRSAGPATPAERAEPDGPVRWAGPDAPAGPVEPTGPVKPDAPAAPDHPTAPAAIATWSVPARIGRDYAAVSGDRNPIHTSRLGARLLGFPRPIAHGMWSTARCLAALANRLPDRYTVQVAFKRPILLPARVGFSAHPVEPAGWAFGLHDAAAGQPHLTGTVS